MIKWIWNLMWEIKKSFYFEKNDCYELAKLKTPISTLKIGVFLYNNFEF